MKLHFWPLIILSPYFIFKNLYCLFCFRLNNGSYTILINLSYFPLVGAEDSLGHSFLVGWVVCVCLPFSPCVIRHASMYHLLFVLKTFVICLSFSFCLPPCSPHGVSRNSLESTVLPPLPNCWNYRAVRSHAQPWPFLFLPVDRTWKKDVNNLCIKKLHFRKLKLILSKADSFREV